MQFTQIKETSLYVQNLDRTKKFYAGKLGLEVVSHKEGRHIFFKVGSSILLCFLSEATKDDDKVPHYGEGQMHIAFEVPYKSYEQAKSWIQSKDIFVDHEQKWSDKYYSFYFRDPDGHSLEVVPKGMWE